MDNLKMEPIPAACAGKYTEWFDLLCTVADAGHGVHAVYVAPDYDRKLRDELVGELHKHGLYFTNFGKAFGPAVRIVRVGEQPAPTCLKITSELPPMAEVLLPPPNIVGE